MNKFVLSFFIIVLFFIPVVNAENGNVIHSIDMEIYIDENGNAEVTEIWNCTTEYVEWIDGYEFNAERNFVHHYKNISSSDITDFIVTDEDGVVYKDLNSHSFFYDINKSVGWSYLGGELVGRRLSEHKYKSTINESRRGGTELCWAISETGEKTYILDYKIKNFIKQFADAQAISMVLIPADLTPKPIGEVTITIFAEEKFPDDLQLWAAGNNNYTFELEDGVIKYNSQGTITALESVDLLVKFPVDMFMTNRETAALYESCFNSFTNAYSNQQKEVEYTGEIKDIKLKSNEIKETIKDIDMDMVIINGVMALLIFITIWYSVVLIKSIFYGDEE